MRFDLIGIAGITVGTGAGAKFAFIPNGQFHRQRGKKRRLDAAETQAGADVQIGAVFRQLKRRVGVAAAFVSGIMRRAAQNQIERNFLIGIEQMINALRNFAAVAGERFGGNIFAIANLIVTVAITAAGQTDGVIGVWSEAVNEAEFRIQINRREGQAKCQIRFQEIRLVVIIKSVAGKGHVALKILIVAELNQITANRVNLRRSKKRNEQRQQHQRVPGFIHADLVTHDGNFRKWGMLWSWS